MEKSRYTIVVIAPPDIQESLKKFRVQFDLPLDTSSVKQQYILKDTAHFAIKRTFFLKQDIKEKDLVEKIRELPPDKKIWIDCLDSGVFSGTPYGEILYARIDYNPELMRLHADIKQKIDDMVKTKNLDMEGKKYMPHLSMAYNIPKEKIVDAQRYLDTHILPFGFYVQHIILLREFDISKDERESVYTHNLV